MDERYITDMESLYVFNEKCRIPEIISFLVKKVHPSGNFPSPTCNGFSGSLTFDPYLQKAIEKYCR